MFRSFRRPLNWRRLVVSPGQLARFCFVASSVVCFVSSCHEIVASSFICRRLCFVSSCHEFLHMTFSTTSNEIGWSKFKSLEVPYCSAAEKTTNSKTFHFILLHSSVTNHRNLQKFCSGLYFVTSQLQRSLSLLFFIRISLIRSLSYTPLTSFSSYNGYKLKSHLTWFRRDFIAQLVEHRTGIMEVMGSNPVGASELFLGFICNCLSYFVTAKISFTSKPQNVAKALAFPCVRSFLLTAQDLLQKENESQRVIDGIQWNPVNTTTNGP